MRPVHLGGPAALGDIPPRRVTTLLLVMLAGSVGVGLRYLVDVAVAARTDGSFPWATLGINLAGALAIGVLAGVLADQSAPSTARVVLGMGLLGGFTTFSAFALETVALVEEGLALQAAAYVAATNVVGIGAAFAGLVIGRGGGG